MNSKEVTDGKTKPSPPSKKEGEGQVERGGDGEEERLEGMGKDEASISELYTIDL